MTVEVLPLGVTCNLSCGYCYEHPIRDAGNFDKSYDLVKIKTSIEKHNYRFTIFGGEPLLVPIKDLEELWRWGFEKHGGTGIQTNGTLITDEHIELFKKYHVHLGMSLDGPDEMNDSRWAGSLEKTRLMTKRSADSLKKCLEQGISASLIVTLHAGNASTPEKLNKLKEWFKMYDGLKLKSSRIHLLEVDHVSLIDSSYILTEEQNIHAMLELSEFEKELVNFKFDMFKDIKKLLVGDDADTTCVWNACDPYTTRAVQGVDSDGEAKNCGRSNKDGVDHIKADAPGFERQLALYNTLQEFNGCYGCRFFMMCKGECPGTAVDADWRNRTRDCKVWYTLFEKFEMETINEGKFPLSLHPRREEMEMVMLKQFEQGKYVTIHSIAAQVKSMPEPTPIITPIVTMPDEVL